MLIQIITHTPTWVFGLLALLLWLGGRQLRAGQVSLVRMVVMPVAMAGLSVYGVWSAFGGTPLAALAWALALLAVCALALLLAPPTGARYHPESRSFSMPGSALPLALMMGIFFTKYAVGVALVMHPGLARETTVALAVSALYGAFSGGFAARALRLWRLVLRTPADAAPATPAVSF
jgi:hypothetical protein